MYLEPAVGPILNQGQYRRHGEPECYTTDLSDFMSAPAWSETESGWNCGTAIAERHVDPWCFVIESFGEINDANEAFRLIVAAMESGAIAIRETPENSQIINELVQLELIMGHSTEEFQYPVFAVMAVSE